jgi:hypothetical protein
MNKLAAYVPGAKPTGSVSTWVRLRLAAIKDGTEMRVPCEGCWACCACGYDVAVDPDDLSLAMEDQEEMRFLAKKADGSCAHLLGGKCSIYSDRPIVCRVFDCREFLFSGIVPNSKLLADAVYQWDPLSSVKTHEDREILVAMKMAGSTFLGQDGNAENQAMTAIMHY